MLIFVRLWGKMRYAFSAKQAMSLETGKTPKEQSPANLQMANRGPVSTVWTLTGTLPPDSLSDKRLQSVNQFKGLVFNRFCSSSSREKRANEAARNNADRGWASYRADPADGAG